MVRETRHLWVGNLPENVRDDKIFRHFKQYGCVENIKILPNRGSDNSVAAFVDFVDIKSARKAHNAVNKMGTRELRTDYNEPGTLVGAARVLDDMSSVTACGREVSGYRAGRLDYGHPQSRERRYERRLERDLEDALAAHDSLVQELDYRSVYRETGASRLLDDFITTSSREVSLLRGGRSNYPPLDSWEGRYTGRHEGASYRRRERGTRPYDYDTDPLYLTLQHDLYDRPHRSPSQYDAYYPRYKQRELYSDDLTREGRTRRHQIQYRSRSRSPRSIRARNWSPQRPPRSPSSSGSRSRSSRSASLSSSGSGNSSDSRSSDTASTDEYAAVSAPTPQPDDEPQRSFGIKVQNLPVRSSDTSLRDGLFYEFKKYGKVSSVQVHGTAEDRYGLVFFRLQGDQEEALAASTDKRFLGTQIDVTAWDGPETETENELRPPDGKIDEFNPKATRTLFVGNLETTTSVDDLRNTFQQFGEIVDIDVKKVKGVPQYAFLQYCDIASVCKAIKKMDGEYMGKNRLKVGFGKNMPTNCVWIGGLSSRITKESLNHYFSRYGPVINVVHDCMKATALIFYLQTEFAQAAVQETKGKKIAGSIVKVDFANEKSQLAFYGSMESSGQEIQDDYEVISESGSDSSGTSSDEYAAVSAPPSQPDEEELPKTYGLKVENLPLRCTDTSLRDGLFYEFKKYGKVQSVQIHGEAEDRYSLVFFRLQGDQEEALAASTDKTFLGAQIDVTAWDGPETERQNEVRPLDKKIDEFHPKATRTLFIGNLEKTTSRLDIHNIFQQFGEIVDIDVKKVNGVPQYAFVQYCDITSVCKAIKKMDGEFLGKNRLKVGFGKSMPTNCVWIDGLPGSVTEQYLRHYFSRYGPLLKVVYDESKGMALILYKSTEYALTALKENKGRRIAGRTVKVDFANQGSQLAFCGSMGLDIRDIYEII